MGSFSGLGIGLSLVFGCILLSLVGELYYLLWWKKRITTSRSEVEDHYTNYAREFFSLSCWKKPTSVNTQDLTTSDANGHEPDLELGSGNKDLLVKGFGEEGVETELMRLHNLCGPPRFLFTIKEETKEDLESDDGKSRGADRSRKGSRTRSLSDTIVAVDTPLSSPYNHHGFNFNPLFESATDAELNRLRSSPPPKFKFLRDAEEKLMRKLMEEAEKNNGSVFKIIVGNNKEGEPHHLQLQQYHSSASQVLPLASSPSTFSTT
uniref:Uncharacterized protein n=1 Tax=Davidia involucrata TaxID=16924 RepID=A0A5B6ZDZ9_DAVIN